MNLQSIKTKIPGVFAAVLIAVLAIIAGQFLPALGAIMLALIFGMIAGNTFLQSDNWKDGLKFSEKIILEISIVLFGFGFDVSNLEKLNTSLGLVILASMFVVFVAAITLGRLLGLSSKLSLLLGAGSAICGSAAIAATAPLIDAEEAEVGLSVGLVNLLGLIGLALLPAISIALHFSDIQIAVLLGGTLQAVGHVVASAFAVNEVVGELAMVVKMSRVVFLVPLLIILLFVGNKKGKRGKTRFPFFIFLFVAAVYATQLESVSAELSSALATVGNFLMAVAMAAIGVGIRLKMLAKISGKGIVLGSALFLLQILMFVGYVSFFLA